MVAAGGEERILDSLSPSVRVSHSDAGERSDCAPCLDGHVERSRGTTWGASSLAVTTKRMTNEWWEAKHSIVSSLEAHPKLRAAVLLRILKCTARKEKAY